MMAWTATQKKWAEAMIRDYYYQGNGSGITESDMQTLLFDDTEATRIGVAVAYAQGTIKVRLEASLTALDDQAGLVEAEIAEIPTE